MNTITTTKKVTTSGNSRVINVTQELKILGVDLGEYVEVEIKRLTQFDKRSVRKCQRSE